MNFRDRFCQCRCPSRVPASFRRVSENERRHSGNSSSARAKRQIGRKERVSRATFMPRINSPTWQFSRTSRYDKTPAGMPGAGGEGRKWRNCVSICVPAIISHACVSRCDIVSLFHCRTEMILSTSASCKRAAEIFPSGKVSKEKKKTGLLPETGQLLPICRTVTVRIFWTGKHWRVISAKKRSMRGKK